MNKEELFDEEMNIQLTELAYVLAEREILKAVVRNLKAVVSGHEHTPADLFDNFDLKQLLSNCFDEALETVYGE